MTSEERDHVERLIREADEWPVGTPMPPEKMQEHIDGAKLATADLRGRINRLLVLTAIWILAWASIILISVWVVRLVTRS